MVVCASILDVLGIVGGVVLSLTGAAIAILGAMTCVEGYARRGACVALTGALVGAAGLWLVGLL